jgi:hypothetical protein
MEKDADFALLPLMGPHRKRGDAALRDTLFNQLVAKRLREEEGSVAESRAGDRVICMHSLVAVPGEEGGTSVSVWIIDKGKPLATPVP